jgi:putative hydrolase of the HAD superfamily
MTPPKFLFFDLGNVLVTFTVERMCRQMAEASGIEPAEVRRAVFEGRLEADYELGRITARDFYEGFCRATGSRPEYDALRRAADDIFELNLPIVPVIAGLYQAGCRLGILSNTCAGHWEHCTRRFRMLEELFHVHALSYRVGAMKPDRAIFQAAARLAGTAPEEIFFTDDVAGHVAGARAAGFDAVQFTSVSDLVAELRRRGLRLNY